MKQSLLAMLNDTEQSLVREAEPARLAQLGEDELLELHVRVRRARTKYTKLYRHGAAQRVGKDASGPRRAMNQKAAAKAEIFEDVLARLAGGLRASARATASALRAERLEAVRKDRSGSVSRQRAQAPGGSGARGGRKAAVKRGGDNQLRSPITEKGTASTGRRQASAGQARQPLSRDRSVDDAPPIRPPRRLRIRVMKLTTRRRGSQRGRSVVIAWKEMARAKVRFGLLIGAIALLVFLILFQQALRDGLLTSFTGAIEHQTAPVLVYSTDGRRNLQSSSITPEQQAQVRRGPRSCRGRSDRPEHRERPRAAARSRPQRSSATSGATSAHPRIWSPGRYPTADGEGIANETDASLGFGLGDVVRVAPGGYRIRIVGQSSDTNIQATPTVFVRYPSWEQVVLTTNPDARTPLPNALGLAPEPGVSPDQLVARVDRTSPDLEALTRADAASKAPGVAQVSRSFLVIFLLYGLVVPLVIGLFFLIITLQKARTLTLLRAIGARSSTLIRALMVQVLVVAGLGIGLGTLLFLPVSLLAGRIASAAVRRPGSRRMGTRDPGARGRERVVLRASRAPHRARGSALGRRTGVMRLALREMRRKPGRFATAVVLLTLIAMLLMLLGGLLDGLIQRSTGAIRAQRADLVTFSSTAETSLPPKPDQPAGPRAGRCGTRGDERGRARRDPARRTGSGERAARPRRCRAVRVRASAGRRPGRATRRSGLRRSLARGPRREAGRHPGARAGPESRARHRVRRRRELLRRRLALGLTADVARGAEREPARCVRRPRRVPGAGRANQRRRFLGGARRDRPRDR